MKFKKWLIHKLINWTVPTESVSMSREEELSILMQMNKIDGIENYLLAMNTGDILHYWKVSNENSELRDKRKGMQMRTRYFLDEMKNASANLKKLNERSKGN